MKRLFPILLMVSFTVGLIAGGYAKAAPAPAPAKVYKLKLQTHMPIDNPTFKRAQLWEQDLEQKSNGRIKFTNYPSNQLAPLAESLGALSAGAIDMLLTSGNMFAGLNNITDFVWIPGIFPSQDDLNGAWWNKGLGDIIDQVYQKKSNVKSLSMHYFAGLTLLARRPVRSLKDWKGLKLGTSGKTISTYVELLGGNPVNIPPQEVYVALQRGTVDATLQTHYTLKSYGLAEVVAYCLEQPLINCPGQNVWINIDIWKGLPPDLQKLLVDTRKDWCSKDLEYIKESVAGDIAYGKEHKVEFITIPTEELKRWDAAISKLKDYYIQACEPQGLGDDARKILGIANSYSR